MLVWLGVLQNGIIALLSTNVDTLFDYSHVTKMLCLALRQV